MSLYKRKDVSQMVIKGESQDEILRGDQGINQFKSEVRNGVKFFSEKMEVDGILTGF